MSGLIFNGNGDVIKAVDGSLTIEGLDFGGGNIEAGIGTFTTLNVTGVLTYEDVKNVDSVGIITSRDNINIITNNKKLNLGASGQLNLTFNGTNSVIQGTAGDTIFAADSLKLTNANASHNYFLATNGGAATLYHANNAKLATTSSGISVTGSVIASSNVQIGDSDEFIAGDGNDLRLWHNATDSYIKNYTGDLWIQADGDDLLMRASDDITLYTQTSDQAIVCIGDGQVELYHNNQKKLETTSTGIKVSGTRLEQYTSGEAQLLIGSSNAGGASIYFDGDSNGDWVGSDYSSIRHTTGGHMEYDADNPSGATHHIFKTGGTERLRILSGGQVNIGGNYTQTAYMAQVAGDLLLQKAQGAYQHPQLEIYNSNNSGHGGAIKFSGVMSGSKYQQAVIKVYGGSNSTDGSLAFCTGNGGDKVKIDSSGRVLIATTSSATINSGDATLQVKTTSKAISILQAESNDGGGNIDFGKSRGGAVVQSGDNIGNLFWNAHDGTDYATRAAAIQGWVDGTPGGNDMPGRITFSTTADGAASLTERMRIHQNGAVSIANTRNYYGMLNVEKPSGTATAIDIKAVGSGAYANAIAIGDHNTITGEWRVKNNSDIAFGTESNHPLTLHTHRTERINISGAGDVRIIGKKLGVNVTNSSSSLPQALSVYGSIYLRQDDQITWNNGDNDISGISGYHLRFRNYNGSSMIERLKIEGGSYGRVYIGDRGGGSIYPLTSQKGTADHPDITTNSHTNLSSGTWYTIAVNGGNRATGRFIIMDRAGSRHTTFTFYAGHNYGGANSQNGLNLIHSAGTHSTQVFGGIRIKGGGTYNGCALQVYLQSGTNLVTATCAGDQFQNSGWTMKEWINDNTDPGGTGGWSSLGTVSSYIYTPDLASGGMSSDGPFLPGFNDYFDIGSSNRVWDDIYASNTTIQTSDLTLKQDIASLTSAEMNAAKRLSTIFKTYRWKDKVTKKGDAARTHTGVIAQTIKTEMEAAGLDPEKYAFYCKNVQYFMPDGTQVEAEEVNPPTAETVPDDYSPTYKKPDGATEKTIYSVRYVELLAFLAAYNEQRFTSIESRLTALEGS